MSTYSFAVSSNPQQSPKLRKGKLRISATVAVYWKLGANAVACTKCSLLGPNQKLDIDNPYSDAVISFLAAKKDGSATVFEVIGGARSACAQ